MTPIQPWDFTTVTSRKGLKGSGIEVGETMFVVSLKPLPEKKSDPYLQRVYAIVLRMGEDGKPLIPKDDNDHKQWVMDPRNLTKVSEEEDKILKMKLEEAYKNEGSD